MLIDDQEDFNLGPYILQYKEIADSILPSLIMRTYGKCNNTRTPRTGLRGILLSIRTKYSQGTGI